MSFRLGAANASLSRGDTGLALAHAVLDNWFPRAGHAAAARRSIGRAARAPEGAHSLSLLDGFVGLPWVVELLSGDPEAPPERDPNGWVDDRLIALLEERKGSYDLASGLAGLGIYALARTPRATGHRALTLVVERLASTARPEGGGLGWCEETGGVARWNLGLAHGTPGVIAFLASVVRAKTEPATRETAERLLDGAGAWLLACDADAHGRGGLGYVAGEAGGPARLGWCYGDAGVAIALLSAARVRRRADWKRAAIRMALRAATRSFDAAGVVDPGLCHGAAGVAHIFHRLYRATSDERLGEASRRWFAHLLATRGRRGIAGFAVGGDEGAVAPKADPSFITGAAGIALALTAAIGRDSDWTWDQALLPG